MKVLTSKIVNGKKMFLIEDNNPQGKVFAQVGKPIKKENISYYNPYYVDVKGINPSDNVSTKLTPSKKITPQEIKKIKESPTNVGNIKIKEAQEKAQRLKEAEEAYKKRKAGAPITPELLAQETQAIGDKISLQNIPGVGQYIPDMLDVTGGLGSMASNLGALPLNLNRGNYGQAALSVVMPLGVGALAGIGNPNTGQFTNNLINPFAGTGQIINKLGNKYLPNAYKLNPFAKKVESFNNPNSFYRQVDDETFKEGLESGLIKGKQNVDKTRGEGIINLNKSFGDDAYYKKSSLYSPQRADYIYEVQKGEEAFIPKVNNRTRGYTTENTPIRVSREPIPLNEANIYQKDWLKGYKQIDVPKQQFKSEIDWGKWNKEIPNNTQLMNEYNTIEQTSKANGTWMKNPDGTDFPGTPEQFVQMNSSNFKNAFGNTKVLVNGRPQILTHNSPNTFSEFSLNKVNNGRLSGDGVYTFEEGALWKGMPEHFKRAIRYPAKINQSQYGKIEYHLYGNSTNPKIGKGQFDDITKDIVIDSPTSTRIIDDINRKNIHVFPNTNQLKSAIGNNGMFDMTNPNIYKTLIPGAMTLGALNQTNEKQFGGTIKILNTKIENGKKYFLINE